MVFSPSLNASTKSLFTQPVDDERQELRGSRKKETSPSQVTADDDESHPVIIAPLPTKCGGGSGGRGGSGAEALTIEMGRTESNSSDISAAIPENMDASSLCRAAERIISSPQDKDFVEEVSLEVADAFNVPI